MITIKLDTADFSVQLTAEGRLDVQIDGAEHTVRLDLDPLVGRDLAIMLIEPEAV